MSGQIPRPMGSITLVAALIVWSVSVAPAIGGSADDCLAEPNSPAPAGQHWYYHMDSAKQRKCWYTRATDPSVQPAAAEARSDPANLRPSLPIPLDQPAPASASGPISISPADSTPPAPRIKVLAVKPQRPPVSGMTRDQPVQPKAEAPPQASSTPLISEAPAPQANLPSQTNGPASAANRPTATPAWPDPPAARVIAQEPAQEPAAASRDTRSEFTQPAADAPASDDTKNIAPNDVSTTKTAEVTTSASLTPVEIFPIVAFGLIVAGFLLRVVMKITAARRRRITVDRHDFDQVDGRLEHELFEDQNVHQRDALSEYLQRSNTSAANDSSLRGTSRVRNDRSDITRTRDSIFEITNKISMRARRRIDANPRESEWTDDRRQRGRSDNQEHHESVSVESRYLGSTDDRPQKQRRNDQQQHGPVDKVNGFSDDLQRPLIAAASEPRSSPSLLQANDEWSNGGKDSGALSNEVRERQEVLEKLRRDLDRMLQSPKVA
jgi:hypothetical protein